MTQRTVRLTKKEFKDVKMSNFSSIFYYFVVMTSPGPAFQECTGSYHVNVPTPNLVKPGAVKSTTVNTVLWFMNR